MRAAPNKRAGETTHERRKRQNMTGANSNEAALLKDIVNCLHKKKWAVAMTHQYLIDNEAMEAPKSVKEKEFNLIKDTDYKEIVTIVVVL